MSTLRNAGFRSWWTRHMARVGPALGIAALLGGAVACADVPSAPGPSPAAPSAAKGGVPGKPAKTVKKQPKGSKPPESRTFVYDPTKKLVQAFGNGHQVTLPAGAVCDPATSGYGVKLWDTACAALAKPITFTVTWWEDATGRTNAEFSPDVRFVPGRPATLELTERGVKGKDETATIYWCPTGSAVCHDESDDAAVQTHQKGSGNVYTRPLKHFSGYNVVFGRTEEAVDGGY